MLDYEKMTDRELSAQVFTRIIGDGGDFKCPRCGGREFGSTLGPAPEYRTLKRNCQGDNGCRWSGPPSECAPDYADDAWWVLVEEVDVGFVQIDNGWRVEPHERGWTVKIVAPGVEGEATAPTIGRAVCIARLRALDAQAGGA